jgi:hypothetical protein
MKIIRKIIRNNKLMVLKIVGLLLAAIGMISFITSNMGTTAFIIVIIGSIVLIGAFTVSIFAETVDIEEPLVKIEDLPSLKTAKRIKEPCNKVAAGVSSDYEPSVEKAEPKHKPKPKRKYKKRAPRRKKPAAKTA